MTSKSLISGSERKEESRKATTNKPGAPSASAVVRIQSANPLMLSAGLYVLPLECEDVRIRAAAGM
jgi:hypothetical protein